MARKRTRGNRVYFVARFYYPTDPTTGRRPKPKEFWASTQREAKAKRDAFKGKYEQRTPSADRVTTFGVYIESRFIPDEEARYNTGELSWTRYQARKSRLSRFIIDRDDKRLPVGARASAKALAESPLPDLSPEMLDRLFGDLLRGRVIAGVRNALRRDLHLALKRTRRALTHPVSEFFIDLPIAREEKKRKLEFDADDVLDRIEDESLPIEPRAIVAFIFMLNCRPGEMFALRWSDVDWRSESVTISRAVSVDKNAEGGYRERDTTKTGRAGDRANLPLGPLLADLLRRVQRDRMARCNASDFVFCDQHGLQYCKDSFRYAWRRIRAELKLPAGPTFYSLKTTGNSYALAHGATTAAQAKKMGHTTTRMADNVYRSLQSRELVDAVNVYDRRRSNVAESSEGETAGGNVV